MKKTYLKPDMRIVQLQQHHQLLAGSLTQVQSTGLDSEEDDSEEDELIIDEKPNSGWGR